MNEEKNRAKEEEKGIKGRMEGRRGWEGRKKQREKNEMGERMETKVKIGKTSGHTLF